MITENEYAQWLFNVPGLGSKGITKLLEDGAECRDIFIMSEKELEKRIEIKKARAISELRKNWDFNAEREKLIKNGVRFVANFEKDFPKKLKEIPDAPFALYVKGRLPKPEIPSVAVIGARMCSDYGRYMAREFGKGLALSGVQVISGMARGVDGISQKAAIEAGGSSFGVLGCGVNVCYPEENRNVYDKICGCGGLISEYYPDMLPMAGLFPQRNRLISGLADIIVVVEARRKSGTQITVDQALEQGREVLAIPGRATDRLSDGCNLLISQGAGVAVSVQDVIDRLYGADGVSRGNSEATNSVKRENLDSSSFSRDSDRGGMDTVQHERSIEDEILEAIGIIPVSTSHIMEALYRKEISISIPQLMSRLMDMTCTGRIVQDGVYYRKKIC